MSDGRVSASLDDLETLLGTLMDDPNPEAVAAWHASFKEALAGAEKGPQWAELSARARQLGKRLDERLNQLQALRGAIRQELQAREKGRRALSGYRPG
jgi:flagellar hook-associated protein FlgK